MKVQVNLPQVNLTTAFLDYALESYDLNIVDYLLKLISFQRFVNAVAKVRESKDTGSTDVQSSTSAEQEDFIFIKSSHAHLKITIGDIRDIKSDRDYTEIFLGDKKHLSAELLHYWLDKLGPHNFHRMHKSYLLNTNHLQKIVGGKADLDQEIEPK